MIPLTSFIHELFKIFANYLKYIGKMKTRKKQGVFDTGWKAYATRFLAA
jgi:hypothetical protein